MVSTSPAIKLTTEEKGEAEEGNRTDVAHLPAIRLTARPNRLTSRHFGCILALESP